MTTYHSFSSEKTKEFGEKLAGQVASGKWQGGVRNKALVIALRGDLGTGKTTFTQGFFKGLGIKRRAVSPTFVIMRRYKIPKQRQVTSDKRQGLFADVYHFDAYRLKKAEDLEVLEFGDILSNPQNIILIEWPERIKEILPKSTVWLRFWHGKKENERKISFGG
jgi:tRNA threonylcarbamoyladenosine biosynthesis protein TsaE